VETVVRVRGAGVDEYGDPIEGGSSTSLTVRAVAPRYTSDPADPSRSPVIDGFTLYFPPGVDIAATDKLTVRGGTYEVDGEPGEWVSPFTNVSHGIEVNVRRGRG
jgi:hypothetical protein